MPHFLAGEISAVPGYPRGGDRYDPSLRFRWNFGVRLPYTGCKSIVTKDDSFKPFAARSTRIDLMWDQHIGLVSWDRKYSTDHIVRAHRGVSHVSKSIILSPRSEHFVSRIAARFK